MENLAVLTAFYHSGSFRNHLLGFGKKIKMLFTSQGRSVLGKTVPSVLCTARGPRPEARGPGSIQDRGYSFSQYGPPVVIDARAPMSKCTG